MDMNALLPREVMNVLRCLVKITVDLEQEARALFQKVKG